VNSAHGLDTSRDRIDALKRIQRRSHMSPNYPVADPMDNLWDNGAKPPEKQKPKEIPLDKEFAKHLRSVTRYLRSASTEWHGLVDRAAIVGMGEEGTALSELLDELSVLKQRDSSAAGVLKLAKDNLDKRGQHIHELQAELEQAQTELTRLKFADAHKSQTLEMTREEVQRMKDQEEVLAAKEKDVEELQRALNERERVMASLFRQAKDEWETLTETALVEQRTEANRKIAALEMELAEARSGLGKREGEDTLPGAGQSEYQLRQTLAEHMATIKMMQEKMAVDTAQASAKDEEIEDLRADLKELKDSMRDTHTDLLKAHEERRSHENAHTEKEHVLNDAKEKLEEALKLADEQRRLIAHLEGDLEVAKRDGVMLKEAEKTIEELERRMKETDLLVDGVREERFHMDEIITELKQKRIMIQQKDALIAELNEQMHATDALNADRTDGPSLFKQQQLQRDLQELRTAVHQRDQLITELSSRLQLQGGGDVVRDSQLAERERIVAAQTQQLQLVSQHQFEMQAQLASVQKALHEQQELLLAKAEEHARQQEHAFQLAAQSQQLAALQEGINRIGVGGGDSYGHMAQHARDGGALAPHSGETNPAAEHEHHAPSSQVKAASIMKAPTPGEYSKNQGPDGATAEALRARETARSAAAAAAVARHNSGLTVSLPTEVTM
jgi:DNA repair exonuclease SbcCD ATPase subunit